MLELFDSALRNDAIQAIVARGKFDREPPYREDAVGVVKDVVLCPQNAGLPLVAVFLRSDYDAPDDSPRSGHLVVVRADGTLIPIRGNNNSLDGYFGDLNGDGLPELVWSSLAHFHAAQADVLHVWSLTEEFPEILQILSKPDTISWRIHQDDPPKLPLLELHTQMPRRDSVVAQYRWNAATKSWEGAPGSIEAGFLLVRPGEDVDRAALSLAGKPDCKILATSVAWALPDVRRVMDDAGPDARPGGIDYADDPSTVDFSIGFHHDDRVENVFFVSVEAGVLSVTGPAGPIPIPPSEQEQIASACQRAKK